MMFLGSIDAIETAAGWMALAAVPIAVAAVAGLALASFVRRDPASRHAILALALVAVCGSPCGVWFAQRAGWSLFILPWLISPPPPVAPLAVSTDGRDHLANANSIDRLAPRDVAEIEPGSVASPIEDVRSTHLRETTGDQALTDRAGGPLASNPADGHRLSAYAPLAAVIGLATWVVGLVFFLARMVHGWLAVRRMCRHATPLDRDRFAGLIESVGKQFGLRSPLRIVVSGQLGTAAALGGLHQQIILPTSYVAQLSPDELEPVLIHETAHLVRQDAWIALLQRLAAAVYWPHPLVHVLNRRLARAREECCDNYVLQQLEPRRYSQLLLRLAEWPASWSTPAPTLAFLTRRWKLEERIADLLDAKRQSTVHPRRTFVALAGTAIAAVALASAGLRLTQAADNPAAAEGIRTQTETASAAAPSLEKNPPSDGTESALKEPAAAGGTRPAPRMDLPGHASVRLGSPRLRTAASDLAFLSDGKTIVSASWRDGIKYWDIATGTVRLWRQAKASRMLMTADSKRLITQDTDDRKHSSLQIWSTADGNHVADVKWPRPNPAEHEILQALTPDGTAAILSGPESRIVLRDLVTGRVLKESAIPEPGIGRVALSPDGALLAFTSGNELFLWEWRSNKPRVVVGPRQRYLSMAFSPDGKHLAAGGDTKKDVRIFNVKTHALEWSLRDPNTRFLLVHDLAFTPDGKQLAAANSISLIHGYVAGVLVWSTETGALVHRFSVSGTHPSRLAISGDGKLLAAPMGRSLHVWNLQTGQSVSAETTGHTAEVCALCFSAKGERIVTASFDGTARIWNAVTGRELHQLDHGGKNVLAAAISPDEALAATSGLDGKVCIWQMETGKQVHALEGHGTLGGFRALEFSFDGTVLYSWGDDKKLRVWDVATGHLKRAFVLERSGTHDGDPDREKKLQEDPVAEVDEQWRGGCFRDGGKQLVLVSRNRYWLFDTATGRETATHTTPSVLRPPANRPAPAPVCALVCAETSDRLLMSSDAPYQPRKAPSGEWVSEAVSSGRLMLLVPASDLPLWSTTLEGITAVPIAVSRDGRLAAAGMGGYQQASIGIFDGKTGSLLKSIKGADPSQDIRRDAAFSQDSSRLAVAQTDGTVLIWDLGSLGLK